MMKHLRNIILILFTLTGVVKAQEVDVQIYSPTTYSLGQYGDVPVDLSRGLPQINIPLMSLTDKDIDVNVSLSYHASGIKVDQEASVVGLGWALNAGGVITRQVRGVPDDGYSPFGGFRSRTDIPDYNNADFDDYDDYGGQVENTLSVAAGNGTDNGADIFYYNFCGKSGKFFLDENANAYFAEYQNFKVDFIYDPPGYNIKSYFIIKDDAGVEYEFREHEVTIVNTTGKIYISAWYLSKITGPSGGEITFSYVTGGLISNLYQSRSFDVCYMGIDATDGYHRIPAQYTGYNGPSFQRFTTIDGIVLNKIETSAGNIVEFEFDTDSREDSESMGNNKVDAIVLKDENGNERKRFELQYDYFEANNNHKTDVSGAEHLNKRLRLDAVEEVSADKPPYQFSYYGDDDPTTNDPYTLPYRLSPCQDHWGYYNNSSNTSIFPNNPENEDFFIADWMHGSSMQGGRSPNLLASTEVIDGGTREPDSAAVKAAVLNKIIYPTGGYTEFDFEAQFLYLTDETPSAGGLRVKQVSIYDNNGLTTVKNYEYDPYYFDSHLCSDNKYFTRYYSSYDEIGDEMVGANINITYGVPADLANNYEDVLRIDGTRQARLGAGGGAIYTHVSEIMPGNGRVEYNYTVTEDFFTPQGDQIDGVPTPGLFHSAGVVTQTINQQYNANYIAKDINVCTQPFPEAVDNDWRCGLLISKEVFSEGGQIQSLDSFKYEIKALYAVQGYKVLKFDELEYLYARYYNVGGMAKLTKKVDYAYNPGGGHVKKSKSFEYNSRLLPTKITTSRSIGNIVNTLKYAYESNGTLETKNILTPVSESKKYRNSIATGNLLSTKLTGYNSFGNPTFVKVGKENNTPETRVSYTYNSEQNIVSIQKANDIPTSYIWGYNNSYPIAKVINATDNEIFFDSFEDPDTWDDWYEWYSSESFSTFRRTGRKSLKVENTSGSENYFYTPERNVNNLSSTKYKASCWVYSNGPTAQLFLFYNNTTTPHNYDGHNNVQTSTTGSWKYIEVELNVPATAKTIFARIDNNSNGTVYFDDVRIYPADAQMTTYTYDPLIGMTSITDPNGKTTYYEYDNFGRLKRIKDHERNIIEEYDINYK